MINNFPELEPLLLIDRKIELIVNKIIDPTSKKQFWQMFSSEHYLTSKLNIAADCYICFWDNVPVAFNSALRMPHPIIKNAYREHRLVVLSDYQGLGFGKYLSEFLGEYYIYRKKTFFSKTSNPKLGEYRNNSLKWRNTSKNQVNRKDGKINTYNNLHNKKMVNRISYSHEYIGIINE